MENRVVEMAVRNVIEPIFERTLPSTATDSGLGGEPKTRCGEWTNCSNAGKCWVVDADLKGYFDSIPQDKLEAAIAEHIADGAVLELIRRFLKQGVMESGKGWSPTETGHPARGGAQPAAGQHLPQPAGPPDGPAGQGDGALRGRLHYSV